MESTYRLDDERFTEAELSRVEADLESMQINGETLPSDFPVQVAGKNKKLWKRIHSEAEALEAQAPLRGDGSGHVARYLNDQYIACELLRLNYRSEHVYTVLTHPEWFSGEKWRTEGFHESYIYSTIALAQRWVTEEPLKNGEQVGLQLLATYSLLNHHQVLYRYDEEKGVYVPCESLLKANIQLLASGRWTTSIRDTALEYIRDNRDQFQDERISKPGNTNGLVNVVNGMLRLESLDLIPHKESYESLIQINADWQPKVDTAGVDAFVASILPADTIDLWWMFCGYCLVTDTPLPLRMLLALTGPRRTGKSTLLRALEMFLGSENCSTIPLTDLAGEGNQFTTSGLVNKMLNYDDDANYDQRLSQINLLKKLAEGGKIRAEIKYKKAFDVDLYTKFAFAMNGSPKVTKPDEAFFDRWRIIPVRTDQKPFEADNPQMVLRYEVVLMSDKANRNAWLRRSIEGLRKLLEERKFPEPESCQIAKGVFRDSSDDVSAYWNQCTIPDNPMKFHKLTDFYDAYYQWLCESHTQKFAVTKHRFANRTAELIETGVLKDLNVRRNPQWAVAGRQPGTGFSVKGQIV